MTSLDLCLEIGELELCSIRLQERKLFVMNSMRLCESFCNELSLESINISNISSFFVSNCGDPFATYRILSGDSSMIIHDPFFSSAWISYLKQP